MQLELLGYTKVSLPPNISAEKVAKRLGVIANYSSDPAMNAVFVKKQTSGEDPSRAEGLVNAILADPKLDNLIY